MILSMLGRQKAGINAHERAAVLDSSNFVPWVGMGLGLDLEQLWKLLL